MHITLAERTAAHVSIYWHKTQDAEIKALLPSAAQSEEQALELYHQSVQPGANSYGRVILADGQYVGDIWCYCIDEQKERSAMLSYCIFEKALWGKGIAAKAGSLFLREVFRRYDIDKMGAFTYASNRASIRVLEKLGFDFVEEWEEDGVLSRYFELKKENLILL
ncbi:MAG: GNAT family N-acetyltransferase [Oscillospiraceae bacterium]|nr:GNAT family N-acetyltransferase [Oscillospiraceae bacterium]